MNQEIQNTIAGNAAMTFIHYLYNTPIDNTSIKQMKCMQCMVMGPVPIFQAINLILQAMHVNGTCTNFHVSSTQLHNDILLHTNLRKKVFIHHLFLKTTKFLKLSLINNRK